MGNPAKSESLREPELAGAWYPADRSGCERSFGRFEEEGVVAGATGLRAGILPHAGWVFSGSIAYNVVRELARRGRPAETLVLFAGHLPPRAKISLMASGSCWTPYGPLEVDEELARAVIAHVPGLRVEEPRRHSQDNSAEVQFPLLKRFFPEAKLLLFGAPPRVETLDLVAPLLEEADSLGRELLFFGSTDLSHYGPNYGWMPKGRGPEAERWVREVNDARFIEAALAEQGETIIARGLAEHSACCPGAAAAAIHAARRLGNASGQSLRYATSTEIRPDESFVGYAGLVF